MTTYLKIAKLNNIDITWSLLNMRQICRSILKEDLRDTLQTLQQVQFFVVTHLHSVWEAASEFILTAPWDVPKSYQLPWGLGKGRRLKKPGQRSRRDTQPGSTLCPCLSAVPVAPAILSSRISPFITHPHHRWTQCKFFLSEIFRDRWFHVDDGKNNKGISRKTFPARRHKHMLEWGQSDFRGLEMLNMVELHT